MSVTAPEVAAVKLCLKDEEACSYAGLDFVNEEKLNLHLGELGLVGRTF